MLPDDISQIAGDYDKNSEYEWDRLLRHQVEYGLTMRALREHLPPPPAAVADIGGSVGRYAIALTRQGYEVTLVDIAAQSLAFAQQKAKNEGVQLARVVNADARRLDAFDDDAFDAVLLMGPLYHLLEHAERVRAVLEARRILRVGGRIFAAFVTPYSMIQYGLAHYIEYVAKEGDALDEILREGIYRRPPGRPGFPDAWLAYPQQVEPLMREGGFRMTTMCQCDALAYELEDELNTTTEQIRERWLDLLYKLSRDPSIMGGGGHILYVGEKH
jgi:ubiquinone/menaquinone biosynthesis C-methylase UbiE